MENGWTNKASNEQKTQEISICLPNGDVNEDSNKKCGEYNHHCSKNHSMHEARASEVIQDCRDVEETC